MAALQRHDHACLLHASAAEQREALVLYFREALDQRERVMYVLDQDADTDALEGVRRAGIDVEDALDDGALIVRTTDETYLDGGTFIPDRVIARFVDEERQALADGFRGLRVATEMSWALQGIGTDQLVEYERMATEGLPNLQASAICQYDARRFPPDVLDAVARVHPVVLSKEPRPRGPAGPARADPRADPRAS